MIIANPGVKVQHAAGTFAIFGGIATGLHADSAQRIRTDSHEQLAIRRLRDVKTIEQG